MDQVFSTTNSELTKSGPTSPPTKRPCVEDHSSTSISSTSTSSSTPSSSEVSSSPQEDAFADLKLTPQTVLDSLQRAECPLCHLKRKYFCYDCCIPFGDPQLIPKIDLPFFIDVVHHPTELPSKSTAMHARVLCPERVSLLEFPDEVQDFDPETTVLLFPSKDAVLVKDLDVSKIKRMVCVDSQWHRTKKMMSDPRLQKLRCVKIESYKTRFWRYQKEGDTCLATIEAIYYFAKEFEEARSGGNYQGQFDDLLWYYSHMYRLIQKTYKTNPDKRFNKIDNYIKY